MAHIRQINCSGNSVPFVVGDVTFDDSDTKPTKLENPKTNESTYFKNGKWYVTRRVNGEWTPPTECEQPPQNQSNVVHHVLGNVIFNNSNQAKPPPQFLPQIGQNVHIDTINAPYGQTRNFSCVNGVMKYFQNGNWYTSTQQPNGKWTPPVITNK